MSSTAEDLTAVEDRALGPCGVCSGFKSEHKGRIHAFTRGTEMVTQEQARKAEAKQQPQVIRLGSQTPVKLGELVQVLVEKGIFDADDVMRVTGLKEVPHGNGS